MVRIVKKPEERRREIIAMAQKLFLEKDYESTSLNDVIGALSVAKGTVYYYFPSKEALLDAVAESMTEAYLVKVQKKLEKHTGTALTQMKILVAAMDVSKEYDPMLGQLHRPGNMVLHIKLLALTIKKIAPQLADLIAKGCDEGIFNTEHPLEAAELLFAGFQFITDIGIFPWSHQELTRRAKVFANLAEGLLRASKGSLDFLSE